MTTKPICWICAGEFAEPFKTAGDLTQVDCRTCGAYLITGSLLASTFPLPDSERYRFSYWNKRRQLEGRPPTPLSGNTIDAIVAQLPIPATHEKPDLLLVSLTLLHPEPGKNIKLDFWRECSLACARNQGELEYFTRCLIDRNDIMLRAGEIQINRTGWEKAAELAAKGGPTSKTAFIAMWFDATMQPLRKTAFEPAIERAGFEPRFANEPEHNEQIDARIVTEIKQSRFVVADVTGARTGVYFEAGFAIGLGRPVIWTCRHANASDMHFDTRQYNHILWDDAADLREKLYYRIVATI